MITRTRWVLQKTGSTGHWHVDFCRLRLLNLQIVRIDNEIVSASCNPFALNRVHAFDIGNFRAYVETCGAGIPDPSLMISGRIIPQCQPFDLGSLGVAL